MLQHRRAAAFRPLPRRWLHRFHRLLHVVVMVTLLAGLIPPGIAQAAPPALTLNTSSGQAGTGIVVTGSGYAVSDAITITFNGATTNAVSDAAGGFTANLTAPAAPAAYLITASDTQGGSFSITFTVTPPPSVFISPGTIRAGCLISVSGSNFTPFTNLASIAITWVSLNEQLIIYDGDRNLRTNGTFASTTVAGRPGVSAGVQTVRVDTITDDGGIAETAFGSVTIDTSPWGCLPPNFTPTTSTAFLATENPAIGVKGGDVFVATGHSASDTSRFMIYSRTDNKWVISTAAPTARAEGGGAIANGLFFVMGGRFINQGTTNDSQVLNSMDAFIGSFSGGSWVSKVPMPTARAGFGIAGVTSPDGNHEYVYVFGGRTGVTPQTGTALSVVERYDPYINAWTTRAPMPVAMADVTQTVTLAGKVYLMGGFTGNPLRVSSLVQEYDPVADSWRVLTPMPTRRSNGLAAACRGAIFVFGGKDDNQIQLGTIEVFRPGVGATGTWRTLGDIDGDADSDAAMIFPGSEFAVGQASDGDNATRVFFAGRGANGTDGNFWQTYECPDPAAGTLADVAPPPAPSIALSQSHGRPGTQVTAFATTGFFNEEIVSFRTDNAAAAVLGTAQTFGTEGAPTSGAFFGTFSAPDATPGPHSIVALGNVSGLVGGSATNNFTVGPFIQGINPTFGAPGVANVTVTGLDFGSDPGQSNRKINVGSYAPVPEAGANITWSDTTVTFTVPTPLLSSGVSVAPQGSTSNNLCFRASAVGGPCVFANPVTSRPGERVTVTGSGFNAGETVNFRMETAAGPTPLTTPATVTASGTGTVSASVMVPLGTVPGVHAVVAQGAVSLLSDTALLTVAPVVTCLSPASAAIGQTVVIQGKNFGVNQNSNRVLFSTAGGGTVAATATNWGNSQIIVTAPATAVTGSIRVSIAGLNSNAMPFAVAGTTSLTSPSLSCVSPDTGAPGTRITLTGQNFGDDPGLNNRSTAANRVTVDGIAQVADANIVSWSATRIVLDVPVGASNGAVSVTRNGVVSNSVSYEVLPSTGTAPVILVSPVLTQNAVANIRGSGFAPNQTVSILLNDATLLDTQPVLADGTFVSNPLIPPGTNGLNTLVTRAFGFFVASVSVTVLNAPPTSTITLDPSAGPAPTLTSVSGTGFTASISIDLTLDSPGGNLLAVATTDAAGNFLATFPFPDVTAGPHSVLAGAAVATFTVQGGVVGSLPVGAPNLAINPTSGTAGSNVGSSSSGGLGASQPLRVVWDNPRGDLVLTPVGQATDATGAFTGLTFTVPPTAPQGQHVVTVVGGPTGRSASLPFNVTSPPVPPVESKASIPTGVEGAAAGIIGDTLYVTHGSRSGQGDSGAVSIYSLSGDSWTAGATPGTPRADVAGVAAPDGRLYVLGGRFNQQVGEEAHSILATVEAYTPGTGSWQVRASMPTARAGLGAAIIGNTIYAIGGRGVQGTGPSATGYQAHTGLPLNANEAYDINTNGWTAKAPMPVPMMDIYSTVAIGAKVYVIGGYANARVSSLVQIYDTAADTWAIGTPMPTPRSNFIAAECGGKIYAIGGLDGNKSPLNLIEVYNPAAAAGLEWGSVIGASLSAPRANFAVAGVSTGSAVYLIGGGPNGTFLPTNEKFNCGLAPSVAVAAPAAPTFTLSTAAATPGQSVTAAGSGFAVGEKVMVRLEGTATGSNLLEVTAADGTFSISSLIIPPVSNGGAHTIRAIGAATGISGGAALNITAATLALTPDGGPAGARVQVSGSGFPAGERLQLTIDAAGGTVLGLVQPDTGGGFTAVVHVPGGATAGAHPIHVARQTAAAASLASTPFTVQSVATAPLPPAAPTLIIGPSCGPSSANQVISASGAGYGAGQSVRLAWGAGDLGTTPATVLADGSGTFIDARFAVPQGAAAGIYVVSAFAGSGRSSTALFQVTSTATGPWTCMQALPPGTEGAAAGWINGTLYVSHGNSGGDTAMTHAFDPTSNVWTRLGNAPSPRAELTGVVADNKLFAIGGRLQAAGGVGAVLNTVEVFDPTLGTWDATRTPMVIPRAGLGAAAVGRKIYAIGGRDNPKAVTGTPLTANEEYDIYDDVWVAKAPMPIPLMDIYATAAYNNKMYVFGGYTDNAASKVVQIYDPATDSWSFGRAMPTARSNAIAGECGNRLFTIGGMDTAKVRQSAAEGYDPATDQWYTADAMVNARAEMAAGAIGTGLSVWAVGGGIGGLSLTSNERFACGQATQNLVAAPPAAAVTLAPSAGAPSTQVLVSATGFSNAEQVLVRLTGGGLAAAQMLGTARASAAGAITFSFPVPATAPAAPTYTVTTVGYTSGTVGTAVFTNSVINSVTGPGGATFATAGQLVTISGFGFGSPAGGNRATSLYHVELGGVQTVPEASITGWNDTTITLTLPASATTGGVRVISNGGASNAACFRVAASAGACAAVSPGFQVRPGFTFTVTGSGFANGETATVKWDSVSGTALTAVTGSLSASTGGTFTASFTAPVNNTAAVGPHDLIVTGNGGGSATTRLFIAPAVTCLSPNAGVNPAAVTITGKNFGTVQGIGQVYFSAVGGGTVAAAVTSWSDTTIVVTVPATAVTGPIVVDKAGARSNGIVFAAGAAPLTPAITCFGSIATAGGTILGISGVALGADPGAANRSSAAFNVGLDGVPLAATDVLSWTTTNIDVLLASGFQRSNVVVTSSGVASTPVPFELNSPVTDAPSITLSASGGQVGGAVTVSGANFAEGQTLTLLFDMNTGTQATLVTVPTPVVVAAGRTFAASVTIPAGALVGAHTIDVSFGGVRVASAPFAVTTLSLLPNNGLTGAFVAASGSGYTPGSFVEVRLDNAITGTLLVLARAGAGGSFAAGFTIPGGISIAPHTIWAGSSSATFTVTGAGAGLGGGGTLVDCPAVDFTMTPDRGGPNTVVTVSNGVCLGSNEVVEVIWDNQWTTPIATAATDGNGNFGGFTFVVPGDAPTGPHTVSVFDQSESSRGKTFVVDSTPVPLTPQLFINRTSGPAGTVVSVTGSGFAVSLPITLSWATPVFSLAPVNASVAGALPATSFTIPAAALPGAQSLTATQGAAVATATFLVVRPAITLDKVRGSAEVVVKVAGSGFAPTDDVTIGLDGLVPPAPMTLAASAAGAFEANYTVPVGTPAELYAMAARQGVAEATALFRVETPNFTLSTTNATLPATSWALGDTIAMTGGGFPVSQRIDFCLGGQTVTFQNSLADGTLSGSFSVQAGWVSGTLIAQTGACGGAGVQQATTPVTITANRSATLSPPTGPVGTVITIAGSNFANGAANVAWDGVTAAPPSPLNIVGGAIPGGTTLAVPAGSAAGVHTVTITDSTPATVTIQFIVTTPTVTVSPTLGPVGTPLTVNGAGYTPGQAVTVRWDGDPFVPPATVNAGASGAWQLTGSNVPASLAGTHTVSAVQNILDATTASATFQVTGAGSDYREIRGKVVESDSVTGIDGATVTVTQPNAAGGTPGFQSTRTTPTTATAGEFTFSVPPGSYIIRAFREGRLPFAEQAVTVTDGGAQTPAVADLLLRATTSGGVTVSGRVLLGSGAGVDGALVTAVAGTLDGSGNFTPGALAVQDFTANVSGNAGSFTLTVPSGLRWRLAASVPGAGAAQAVLVSNGNAVTANVSGADLVIPSTVALTGLVRIGDATAGFTPVAQASLLAQPTAANGQRSASASTSNTGAYQLALPIPPPGGASIVWPVALWVPGVGSLPPVNVQVTSAGQVQCAGDDAHDLTNCTSVGQDVTAAGLNFSIATASIQIRFQTSANPPVAVAVTRAELRAVGLAGTVASQKSVAGVSSTVLTVPKIGLGLDYRLAAVVEGYGRRVDQTVTVPCTSADLTVCTAAGVPIVTYSLPNSVTIAGRVHVAGNVNDGIGGAQVMAFGPAASGFAVSTVSNPDGSYSLPVPVSQTYSVVALKTEYAVPAPTSVTVALAGATQDLPLAALPTTTIRGSVSGASAGTVVTVVATSSDGRTASVPMGVSGQNCAAVAASAYCLTVPKATWTVKGYAEGLETTVPGPVVVSDTDPNPTGVNITLTAKAGYASTAPTTFQVDDRSQPAQFSDLVNKVLVLVPAGALGSNTDAATLTVRQTSDAPTTARFAPVSGVAQDITFQSAGGGDTGAAITNFAAPVTIVLSYGGTTLCGTTAAATLQLGYWDAAASEWVVIPSVNDTANCTLTGVSDHATKFAVLSAPASSTPPTPPVVNNGGCCSGGGGGGSSSPAPVLLPGPPPTSGSTVTSAGSGGQVTVQGVTVTVPAGVVDGGGSVTTSVDLTSLRGTLSLSAVTTQTVSLTDGFMLGSSSFQLQVRDAQGNLVASLAKPVGLRIAYNAEDLRRAGGDTTRILLQRYDEAARRWTDLGSTPDPNATAITAQASASGLYGLMVELPAPTVQGPVKGYLTSEMAASLTWSVPNETVWYHLQVLPFNNDGPAINLLVGDPDAVRSGRFEVLPPKLGEGNYTLLPGMTYSWRVRTSPSLDSVSITDAVWSHWTGSTFRTGAPNSGTIALLAPADRTAVATRTPTVQWDNSNRRIFYYEVQVSRDRNFEADPAKAVAAVYWNLVHGGQTVPLNSWTVPAGSRLDPNAVYYWRVRPRVQGDGIPSDWTAPRVFTTPP